jgi:ABC-type glycerol-3-phosphate transport system substrate-binding protein
MIDNLRRIEKKYNCKIDYVTVDGETLRSSLNTSLVAGTPDYDVYMTQLDFALPLAVNGYFADLSEVKADYLDLNNDQNILSVKEIAGTKCFFEKTGSNIASTFLAYNADMIKEAGLTDPRELYENGEWTWEKFSEYCQKLTKDTDNNGETDIYGYGGDLEMTMQEFLASNDAVLVKEDGKEGLSDPKVLKTFEFLGELYTEKKVARPINDDYSAGNMMWINKQAAFGPTQLYIVQTQAALGRIDFEYHIVPFPKGPSGTGESAAMGLGSDFYVIPKGIEKPEQVYQVLEEFYGWYADDYEVRDEDMRLIAEGSFIDESDVEMMYTIESWRNKEGWKDIGLIVNRIAKTPEGNMLINSIFGGVTTGEATPAEAVESVKQLFQDGIDSILKQ